MEESRQYTILHGIGKCPSDHSHTVEDDGIIMIGEQQTGKEEC